MQSILIVEDQADVRAFLAVVLTRAGFHIREAANGGEGIACLMDKLPDLVITDIFMPNQEGLATIMELRRGAPSLKIIAISGGGARASLDVLPVAEALGAHRTLRKPFTPTEVMEVVRSVLEG